MSMPGQAGQGLEARDSGLPRDVEVGKRKIAIRTQKCTAPFATPATWADASEAQPVRRLRFAQTSFLTAFGHRHWFQDESVDSGSMACMQCLIKRLYVGISGNRSRKKVLREGRIRHVGSQFLPHPPRKDCPHASPQHRL